MPFVAAICPQCGGNLQLDNQLETGFCMHCGTKIIVQDAIKSVKIDYSDLVDSWMKMGELALESGNSQEAYELFHKIIEVDFNNWKAMNGLGMALGFLSNGFLKESSNFFKKAIELSPENLRDEVIDDAIVKVTKIGSFYLKNPYFFQNQQYFRLNLSPINYLNEVANEIFNEKNKSYNHMLSIWSEIIDNASVSEINKSISDFKNRIKNVSSYSKPNDSVWTDYYLTLTHFFPLIEKAIEISPNDFHNNAKRYSGIINYCMDVINNIYTYPYYDFNLQINLEPTYNQSTQREKYRLLMIDCFIKECELLSKQKLYYPGDLSEEEFLNNSILKDRIKILDTMKLSETQELYWLTSKRNNMGIFSSKEKSEIDLLIEKTKNKYELAKKDIDGFVNRL